MEVNRRTNRLKIPSYKKAFKFSVENFPERGIKNNNGQLPFGCHDWDNHIDFWLPFLKRKGYSAL
ncbi:DUF5672 family protein [Dyadobacter linearis]|uniref:DUF5672 family protein n=1 Tax=Dyadobacter linearis TaxID=2823330 RepID=UPI0038736BC9